MKKVLLSFILALFAFAGSAQERSYTDKLTLTVNGESGTLDATILYSENGDGTCNVNLKNFILADGATVMPVGNINVKNMKLTKGQAFDSFEYNDILLFENGDAEALPEGFPVWMGPVMFADGLPLNLTGKVNAERIYVNIDMDLTEILGQIVNVRFGEDITDGISNVNAEANTDKAIYSLSGTRLQKLQKGINIVNGKKILR